MNPDQSAPLQFRGSCVLGSDQLQSAPSEAADVEDAGDFGSRTGSYATHIPYPKIQIQSLSTFAAARTPNAPTNTWRLLHSTVLPWCPRNDALGGRGRIGPIGLVAANRSGSPDVYSLTDDLKSKILGDALEARYMARLPPSRRPDLYRHTSKFTPDLIAQDARPQAIGLATVPFREEDGIGNYGKYATPKSSAPPQVKGQVYTGRTARFSPGATSLMPRRREHERPLNVEGASQYHHPWNKAVRANAEHYDVEWATNMFVPVDADLSPSNDLKNALILLSVVGEAVLFVLLDSGCGDQYANKTMSAALPFWDDGPAYIGTDRRNPICEGFVLWDWTKPDRPYKAFDIEGTLMFPAARHQASCARREPRRSPGVYLSFHLRRGRRLGCGVFPIVPYDIFLAERHGRQPYGLRSGVLCDEVLE
ncbi:hypothetical protein L198_00470 [Cryptococcus wingfieldii CBS 7118]|uniref:Uncharacterized protein n=1 Tax=Cryptococcus wingfieldii CBS 7118 TaxID=1295528 RepID=A0A1E3K890_9TREE|nr:hypothetical protein L198_00470 [Cryptococcus wingfieldii CBS 7118]ODO08737.1 hypothetical protein L198_00470 [Cryptococcus wingfieldii CBS 7118]